MTYVKKMHTTKEKGKIDWSERRGTGKNGLKISARRNEKCKPESKQKKRDADGMSNCFYIYSNEMKSKKITGKGIFKFSIMTNGDDIDIFLSNFRDHMANIQVHEWAPNFIP